MTESAHEGTVKFYSAQKGWGFVTPSHPNEKDIFLHVSALSMAGLKEINEGQKIRYIVKPGKDGRNSATEIKLLS